MRILRSSLLALGVVTVLSALGASCIVRTSPGYVGSPVYVHPGHAYGHRQPPPPAVYRR